MKQLLINFDSFCKDVKTPMIVGNYEFKLTEKSFKDFVGNIYKEVKKFLLILREIKDNDEFVYYFEKEEEREKQVEYFKKLASKNKL